MIEADRKVESTYWHLSNVNLGMIRAGVKDGDVGPYESLWQEVRLEAVQEITRAKAELRIAREQTYVNGE